MGWSTVVLTIPEDGVQQQAMVSVVKGAVPMVVMLAFMLGTDNTAGMYWPPELYQEVYVPFFNKAILLYYSKAILLSF